MIQKKYSRQENISTKGGNGSNRRRIDRRKIHSEGFIKLDGVGWYCRRYRSRRKDDITKFE